MRQAANKMWADAVVKTTNDDSADAGANSHPLESSTSSELHLENSAGSGTATHSFQVDAPDLDATLPVTELSDSNVHDFFSKHNATADLPGDQVPPSIVPYLSKPAAKAHFNLHGMGAHARGLTTETTRKQTKAKAKAKAKKPRGDDLPTSGASAAVGPAAPTAVEAALSQESSASFPPAAVLSHMLAGAGREKAVIQRMVDPNWLEQCRTHGYNPEAKYIVIWEDDVETGKRRSWVKQKSMLNCFLRELDNEAAVRYSTGQSPFFTLDTKSNRVLLEMHCLPLYDELHELLAKGEPWIIHVIYGVGRVEGERDAADTCFKCGSKHPSAADHAEEDDRHHDAGGGDGMYHNAYCGCEAKITFVTAERMSNVADLSEVAFQPDADDVPQNERKVYRLAVNGMIIVGDKANLNEGGMHFDNHSNVVRMAASAYISYSEVKGNALPDGFKRFKARCGGDADGGTAAAAETIATSTAEELETIGCRPFSRPPVVYDANAYNEAKPGTTEAAAIGKRSPNMLCSYTAPQHVVWCSDHLNHTTFTKTALKEFEAALSEGTKGIAALLKWSASANVNIRYSLESIGSTDKGLKLKFEQQRKFVETWGTAGPKGPPSVTTHMRADDIDYFCQIFRTIKLLFDTQSCTQEKQAADFRGTSPVVNLLQQSYGASKVSGVDGDINSFKVLPTEADFSNISATHWNLAHMRGRVLASFTELPSEDLTAEQREAGRNILVGAAASPTAPGMLGAEQGEHAHIHMRQLFMQREIVSGNNFKTQTSFERAQSHLASVLSSRQATVDAREAHPRTNAVATLGRLNDRAARPDAITIQNWVESIVEGRAYVFDATLHPAVQAEEASWRDAVAEYKNVCRSAEAAKESVLAGIASRKAAIVGRSHTLDQVQAAAVPQELSQSSQSHTGTRTLTTQQRSMDWDPLDALSAPGVATAKITGRNNSVKSVLANAALKVSFVGKPSVSFQILIMNIARMEVQELKQAAPSETESVTTIQIVIPDTHEVEDTSAGIKGLVPTFTFVHTDGKNATFKAKRAKLVDQATQQKTVYRPGGVLTLKAIATTTTIAKSGGGKGKGKAAAKGGPTTTATTAATFEFVSYAEPKESTDSDADDLPQDIGVGLEESGSGSNDNANDADGELVSGGSSGGTAASADSVELPQALATTAELPQQITVYAKNPSGDFALKVSGSPPSERDKSVFSAESGLKMDGSRNNMTAISFVIGDGAEAFIATLAEISPALVRDKMVKKLVSDSTTTDLRATRASIDAEVKAARAAAAAGAGGGAETEVAASAANTDAVDSATNQADVVGNVPSKLLQAGQLPPHSIRATRMQYAIYKLDCTVMHGIPMIWEACGSCGRMRFICPFKSMRTKDRHSAEDDERDSYLWWVCLPASVDYETITEKSLEEACRAAFLHEYCLDVRGFYGSR